MNTYLKYGLIISGIYLVSFFVLYFIHKPWLSTGAYWLYTNLLTIAVLVYGMYKERETQGEPYDFGERFKFCFLVCIISMLPTYITTMVIFNIDNEYKEQIYNQQIDIANGMTGFVNNISGELDKYEIEEQRVDQMAVVGDIEKFNPYSSTTMVFSLMNMIFFYVIYALIIALFIGAEKLTLKERWRRLDF